jgi:hypothetical protein
VLFLVIFSTGRLKALFFFLFATAAAISRLVIGTLSEDSGELLRCDFIGFSLGLGMTKRYIIRAFSFGRFRA